MEVAIRVPLSPHDPLLKLKKEVLNESRGYFQVRVTINHYDQAFRHLLKALRVSTADQPEQLLNQASLESLFCALDEDRRAYQLLGELTQAQLAQYPTTLLED
jgi:hypothetical protein